MIPLREKTWKESCWLNFLSAFAVVDIICWANGNSLMGRCLIFSHIIILCPHHCTICWLNYYIFRLASVLASLEDTLSDAPRAAEYLGRLLARFVQENILPLQEVGKLIQEGEEPGHLVQDGIAADILWAVLDSIRLEKGDSFLNEVKSSSSLKLEDFRPQHLKRSKLDAFM